MPRDQPGELLLGVLVTFRRPEQLSDHLERLGAQTRPPDHLVLVDNDPSAANRRALAAYQVTGRSAEYLPAPSNLGPAGAIALGMERVLDQAGDDDWVVLLDDDDPPAHPALLAELLSFAATAATTHRLAAVGVAGAPFDWGRARLRRLTDAELAGPLVVDEIGGNQLPLYRVRAIRDVGVFDATLFFGFDDLDYGLRLRRAGWDLVVSGELLADARRHWGRTGRPLDASVVAPAQPPWRRYYTVRNLVAVLRKHGHDRAAAVAAARAGLVRPLLEIPRDPALALRQLAFGVRGAVDGWQGRLGRQVAPQAKPGAR